MKVFSATEAKDEFGRLIDTVQSGPVQIEKKGRAVAVVISIEEYARFQELENSWWADQAKQASTEGYLSSTESEDLLNGLLNAKD